MSEPTRELDCRGMPCPRPIIELARAIVEIETGETIALAADDPAAGVDVQAWCRMRGQDYAGSQTAADGTPVYLVTRLD